MDNNQMNSIKSYDNTANEFMEKIGTLKNYNETYDFIIKLIGRNSSFKLIEHQSSQAVLTNTLIETVELNN